MAFRFNEAALFRVRRSFFVEGIPAPGGSLQRSRTLSSAEMGGHFAVIAGTLVRFNEAALFRVRRLQLQELLSVG